MINASQAEKNRAALAYKYNLKAVDEQPQLPSLGGNTLTPRHNKWNKQKREQNNRIYIGGLVDRLAMLSQQEINQFFAPFGQIDAIELPKDQYTGRNRGHAIVEFSSKEEARIAAQSMNGFELIAGQKLKVNILIDTNGDQSENQNKS